MRGPRRLLWNCQMKGHQAIPGSGDGTIYLLGDRRHLGAICAHCKCAFWYLIDDEKVEESGLIDPRGGKILSRKEGH